MADIIVRGMAGMVDIGTAAAGMAGRGVVAVSILAAHGMAEEVAASTAAAAWAWAGAGVFTTKTPALIKSVVRVSTGEHALS